eukprot:GILI01006577.1.p1 GENE.GILI01006577.1~~GILI01006577.1.p1  ORF type:complete len:128 (-),score=23.30 GILI01006577.1:120-503(-)
MRRVSLSLLPVAGLSSVASNLRLKSDNASSIPQPKPTTKRDIERQHNEKNEYSESWDRQESKDKNPNFNEKTSSNDDTKHTLKGTPNTNQHSMGASNACDSWKDDWPHEGKIPEGRAPAPQPHQGSQ